MISLCEQCKNNNWRKMQDIIDAFKDVGIPRPRHIWCQARNRPEDIHEYSCMDYASYETPSTTPMYGRKAGHDHSPYTKSGHRRLPVRRDHSA